jgi:nitrite reductase/ring-hydroxylating ferredoxin subunit
MSSADLKDLLNPDEWKLVATTEAIPEGEVVPATVEGKQLALYQAEGAYFATDNVCTHEHAYMSDGYLDGCIIECPLHQATFDIRSGKVLNGPAAVDLCVYPVKVVGHGVFVNLCAAKPCTD